MEETRYLISDASRRLKVEPHVLRYWEEELDMKIKRNEMGHRYYTVDDMRVLQVVQEMKNQGIQLRAIKQLIPELYRNKNYNWKGILEQKEGTMQEMQGRSNGGKVIEIRQAGGADETTAGKEAEESQHTEKNAVHNEMISSQSQTPLTMDTMSAELKMEQFQEIMTKIVGKALEANNRSLSGAISNEVSDKVSERVIKQMDYVMRENEERQEERFRKLDEVLRQRQRANAEAAAAEEGKRKKKKKLFGAKTKTCRV